MIWLFRLILVKKIITVVNNNKDKSEVNVNPDRYLVTYSDLITLLLGLFVILYAVSRVDEAKYKEFSKAFSEYFQPSQIQVNSGNGGYP